MPKDNLMPANNDNGIINKFSTPNFNITVKILLKTVILVWMTLCVNVSSETFTFEPPNLKTVLFKETDLMPRCWSTLEVNLLLNRRLMQDIVPRKIPRDLPAVVIYLKSLEKEVGRMPDGINRTLLTSAMADVIGGYLQAIVVPIADEAYYAGNVDYQTVSAIHDMLDKWKWYLSTDGGTWSQQCDMRKIPTKVTVLDLELKDVKDACRELYVSPEAANETETLGSETVVAERPRIAVPYFDNNARPNAIALPFRKRNLYSLFDPKSAYVLVKYYTLAMRCLSTDPDGLLAFNNFFHQWIVTKVVPHLHDRDRWYPAFGAVMRVTETIKQKGLASSGPLFVQPIVEEHQDAALNANLEVNGLKHNGKVNNLFHVLNNPYAILYIFIFMLVLTFILCIFCVCVCLRYRRKSQKDVFLKSNVSENTLRQAVLSLFCGLKESASRSSATKNESIDSNPLLKEHSYDSKRRTVYRPPENSEVSVNVSTSEDEISEDGLP